MALSFKRIINYENNTIYNVEMQRGKHKNLHKRLRYYQGTIDLDLISKGEDYRKFAKSYIIKGNPRQYFDHLPWIFLGINFSYN